MFYIPILFSSTLNLSHTTIGCGKQGFPSAQPYLSPLFCTHLSGTPGISRNHSRSDSYVPYHVALYEKEGNTICHPELAPATLEKYDYAVNSWALISRNESTNPDFPNLPIPTPERLKLFAEFYIKSCKKERETSRSLSKEVKDDPRERFLVNGKDIDYLLRYLFVDNYYDYIYKRVIVYRVADSAFKGFTTITEVLTAKLLKGRDAIGLKTSCVYIEFEEALQIRSTALFYDLEPNYEYRDIEQSISYYRDSNEIARKLEENRDLVFKRAWLYNKKAKRLLAYKRDFIKNWNDFSERDLIPLFDVYKKYLLERSYLSENLLKKGSLDSELSR
ncbi:hypothetical protein N7527_005754 [Penicillium freii]|nr:hypothetical protein N7527_005754 [Penicillium freii]